MRNFATFCCMLDCMSLPTGTWRWLICEHHGPCHGFIICYCACPQAFPIPSCCAKCDLALGETHTQCRLSVPWWLGSAKFICWGLFQALKNSGEGSEKGLRGLGGYNRRSCFRHFQCFYCFPGTGEWVHFHPWSCPTTGRFGISITSSTHTVVNKRTITGRCKSKEGVGTTPQCGLHLSTMTIGASSVLHRWSSRTISWPSAPPTQRRRHDPCQPQTPVATVPAQPDLRVAPQSIIVHGDQCVHAMFSKCR